MNTMRFRNKDHLMRIVIDYLTDNTAEVVLYTDLGQEHMVSIQF